MTIQRAQVAIQRAQVAIQRTHVAFDRSFVTPQVTKDTGHYLNVSSDPTEAKMAIQKPQMIIQRPNMAPNGCFRGLSHLRWFKVPVQRFKIASQNPKMGNQTFPQSQSDYHRYQFSI